jgi:hypothetical protein
MHSFLSMVWLFQEELANSNYTLQYPASGTTHK